MTSRLTILWFLPVLALTLGAGYLGWRLGQPVSDTQIIERYAARYLGQAPEGAARTDCLARAGQGRVRLTVVCVHPSGVTFVYPAGPRGQLLQRVAPPGT